MAKNDWNEYKKLILSEIQENGRKTEKIIDTIEKLREEMASVKTKVTIIGGTAGIVGTALIEAALHIWK